MPEKYVQIIADILLLDQESVKQQFMAMQSLGMNDALYMYKGLANYIEKKELFYYNQIIKNNQDMEIIKNKFEDNHGIIFNSENPNVRIIMDKDGIREVQVETTPVKDIVPVDEEASDEGCDIFHDHRCGLNESGDLWLLMVAAEAWKVQFDNLPKFVNWAYENFNVPFNKDECTRKLQTKMRNTNWSDIQNQEEMIGFIRSFRAQESIRKNDTKKANAIYVAIKDKIRG